jgi:hypothetical protein
MRHIGLFTPKTLKVFASNQKLRHLTQPTWELPAIII